MARFIMGVYDKKTDELEDSGSYDSEEDALNDLINHDIPRGRYGIIEGSENIDGEYRTISEASKRLNKIKKTKK